MAFRLGALWSSSPAQAPVSASKYKQSTDTKKSSFRTGIGQTCAVQFALHGCTKLFLVDLNRSKLEQTKARIQKEDVYPQIELLEANVTSEASMKAMVQQCVKTFGRLDIACNNAGIGGPPARTHEVSVKDYDMVCAVNERGVSAT